MIALLIMAVLLLAGTSFLTLSSTERQIALNERLSVQAALLAEAGIQQAIVKLNAGSYGGEANTPLGSGTFTVGVTPAATQTCAGNTGKDLVATGNVVFSVGKAEVQIKATVDQLAYPFRWGLFSTLRDGILTTDPFTGLARTYELWLMNSTVTRSYDSAGGSFADPTNVGRHGDIGGNADILVETSTTINGDIYHLDPSTGSTLNLRAGVTLNGAEVIMPARETFPVVTPPISSSGPKTVHAGDPPLGAGTYRFDSLTIDNGALLVPSGPATIYVDGDVSIGSNVTIGAHPPTNLTIITKSSGTDTEFAKWQSGSGLIMSAAVYGRNTDFSFGTSSQIYGSVLARTIYLDIGGQIRYDRALMTRGLCRSGKYVLRRDTWREFRPT